MDVCPTVYNTYEKDNKPDTSDMAMQSQRTGPAAWHCIEQRCDTADDQELWRCME